MKDAIEKMDGQSNSHRRLMDFLEQASRTTPVYAPPARIVNVGLRLNLLLNDFGWSRPRRADVPLPAGTKMPSRCKREATARSREIIAGVMSGATFGDVLSEAGAALATLGEFEITYGQILGTGLVHVTATPAVNASKQSHDVLGVIRELIRKHKDPLRMMDETVSLFPKNLCWGDLPFAFVPFAWVFSRLSCGRIHVVENDDMPALRLELPNASCLPRDLRRIKPK